MPRTLELHLPFILPAQHGVKAMTFEAPDASLNRVLNDLGFGAIGYPDHRIGRVEHLTEAVNAARDAGNTIWSIETVARHIEFTVAGDLLTIARGYVPDADDARIEGRVRIPHGTKVVRFLGKWVAWAPAPVTID